ncbi:MAG: undecaprenyl/decaprenyl-phosphate alpha-N-acetylglucosaminyl 1-phosphate transferase [Chloroflexi bacterium]|nr:undecaprenyl/decaprenyl-phosphate alpha-N-acetylglucosaminyl 1-phosphate transferase [Chloroflexota bacterium]
MIQFLLIFVAALILASATTPIAQRVALRIGLTDQPSARKIHLKPKPLMGGVALYLATIVALLAFSQPLEFTQLVGIVIGATLVSFFGLWDDHQAVGSGAKLIVQVVAALILVLTGISVNLFPYAILNLLITLLWVVGITNAFNLLDNMDGLSGGVSAVAASFFLVLAVSSKQVLVGSLAAALLGACIGFLVYNFNPARIFMGDSGALFLGFVLAAVGIKLRFPEQPVTITWMIPVLVLGVPIFDTTLVTISRLRRGKNPLTTPGKDHFSHRLVARGLSHREAVLTIYMVCVAFGLLALLLSHADIAEAYVLGGTAFVGALWALIGLEADFDSSSSGSAGPPRPHETPLKANE